MMQDLQNWSVVEQAMFCKTCSLRLNSGLWTSAATLQMGSRHQGKTCAEAKCHLVPQQLGIREEAWAKVCER